MRGCAGTLPPGPRRTRLVVSLERGHSGKQAVEGRAETVDIGPRTQWSMSPRGLLGTHIGWGAQARAGQRLGRAAGRRWDSASARPATGSVRPDALASPQSTTKRLTVLAEHDVAGLDVAMQARRGYGRSRSHCRRRVNRRSSLRSSSDRLPGIVVFGASWAWKRSMASLRLSPRMNRMA